MDIARCEEVANTIETRFPVHIQPVVGREIEGPECFAPLHGTVTRVSADRLLDKRTDQPYYATKIRVGDPQATGHEVIKIIPGMPAQVFIKTGRGTVALYALKPLLDSFNNAFRED